MVLTNGVVPSDFQDLDFALTHIAPQTTAPDSDRFEGYLQQALLPTSALTDPPAAESYFSADNRFAALEAGYAESSGPRADYSTDGYDDSGYGAANGEYYNAGYRVDASPPALSQTAASQVADPLQESTTAVRPADETAATVAKVAKDRADAASRTEATNTEDTAGNRHLDKSDKTPSKEGEADTDTTDRLAKRHELSSKASGAVRGKVADAFEIQAKESGGKPRPDGGGAQTPDNGKRPIIELTVETPTRAAMDSGDEKAAKIGRSQGMTATATKAAMVGQKGDQRAPDGELPKSDAIAFGRKSAIEVIDLRRSGSETAAGSGNGKSSHEAKTTGSRFEAAAESDKNVTRGSETEPVATGRSNQLDKSPLLTRSTTLTDLTARLREDTNAEIVRSARLVIRGSDSGEIRLNLKPETLGNVRILLEMHDGRVAGRIIVENSSVRDVFEQNLASLSRAFREEGIELDALDVTVSNPDQGSDDAARSGEDSQPKVMARTAAQFAETVPDIELIDVEYGRVNLVV